MTETTEQVQKSNKTSIIDEDKNTQLHYLAAFGDEDQVKTELKNGHRMDPENYLGWTPLMMAVRNGNVEASKVLIAGGADTTKKNKFGCSIFLISTTSGSLELVRLILDHLLKGGVSRQSLQKNLSPLALAILFEFPEILHYLIEQSFDLNATTPLTGITPLMFAAAMADQNSMQTLIEKGAEQNLCNHINSTAHAIFISKSSNNTNAEVNKNKARPNPAPLIIVNQENVPFLQLTPYPVANNVNQQTVRKSSNIALSPNFYISPDCSPINPIAFIPIQPPYQIFFPPEFSPNHFISPATSGYNSNELLNISINPGSYYSPLSPFPQVCFNNPPV